MIYKISYILVFSTYLGIRHLHRQQREMIIIMTAPIIIPEMCQTRRPLKTSDSRKLLSWCSLLWLPYPGSPLPRPNPKPYSTIWQRSSWWRMVHYNCSRCNFHKTNLFEISALLETNFQNQYFLRIQNLKFFLWFGFGKRGLPDPDPSIFSD